MDRMPVRRGADRGGLVRGGLLAASSLLCAALLGLAPSARGASADQLSLNLDFFANGTMSLTLPSGSSVGTASGAPTVIPAGYYTIFMVSPGGCGELPDFNLQGPGTDLVNNMEEGEESTASVIVDFAPDTTYTWWDADDSSQIFTFQTSSDVLGTAPPQLVSGSQGLSSSNHSTSASSDIVGSATSSSAPTTTSSSAKASIRGNLVASLSASGRLTLTTSGKSVSVLEPGRYTITVTDRSASEGLMLTERGHAGTSLAGAALKGSRTLTVELGAGAWLFTTAPHGKASLVLTVS